MSLFRCIFMLNTLFCLIYNLIVFLSEKHRFYIGKLIFKKNLFDTKLFGRAAGTPPNLATFINEVPGYFYKHLPVFSSKNSIFSSPTWLSRKMLLVSDFLKIN